MWISIDREGTLSLSKQIYQQIKELILTEGYKAGEKLPSTRTLSKELQVTRNIVLEAYEQLLAEGYLEAKQGSKTVVADGISLPKQKIRPYQENKAAYKEKQTTPSSFIDFRSGIPCLSAFPKQEWAKLFQSIGANLPDQAFRYSSPAGVWELRKAIANYVFRVRGISCDPAQIMIVSGATQGLSLLSRLLFQEGNTVFVEEPTHMGLRNVILQENYLVEGIPVDEKGMQTNLLTPREKVSFLYTTPSHQYPMGGILPIQRRLAMIRYAKNQDCYLIEDDYDSEFRYEGSPVHSLYELCPERVIYLSSFSKILAPSIRLGYLILPIELLDSYKKLKTYTDVHTETLSQYVLAEFIQSGRLEKHIYKMKKIYQKKRAYLLSLLKQYFGEAYQIKGEASGLHFIVCFPTLIFTEELVQRLQHRQVKLYPLLDLASHSHELIMGYGHLSEEEMKLGLEVLQEELLPLLER